MGICDLIEFLSRDIKEDDSKVKVTYRLTRFFNGLCPFHVMILDNIVGAYFANEKDTANEMYEEFLKNHPEISFNKEGNSPATLISQGDIQLFAIDELYKVVNNKIVNGTATTIDYQIFFAKNLFPLKDIQESDNYLMHRKLLLKKVPELKLSDFKEAERILKDTLGENKIMPKVIGYIENSKYSSYRIFLEHFFIRVRLLELDKNLKNPSTKEFIETLKKNM